MILPKRVFNSPLIRYATFEDGSHINLIRINKPYANGNSYAIHDTTGGENKMYRSHNKALIDFYSRVLMSEGLIISGITGNAEY